MDFVYQGKCWKFGDNLAVDADLTKKEFATQRETRLEVLRDGWAGPRTVATVRDEVHTPAVTVERVDDRVVYARLVQFQDGAADELRSALEPLERAGTLKALILDLRGNPGGLLDEAVATADLFLDSGTIADAEQYGYSAAWTLYGLMLLGLGTWMRSQLLRYASAVVILLTVLKVFLIDASDLTGLYRVASFLGLGLSLIGIGYLYQRLLFRRRE